MNIANSLRSIDIFTEANLTSTNMVMVKNYLTITFAAFSVGSTLPQVFLSISSSHPDTCELHLLPCNFPKRSSFERAHPFKNSPPCHSLVQALFASQSNKWGKFSGGTPGLPQSVELATLVRVMRSSPALGIELLGKNKK